MRCTYCNSDIPENSRFCPVCGAKQELAADVASAAVAANATDILAGIQANPQPAPDAAPSTPVQEFTQPAQVDTQPANNYTQPQQPYAQPQQDFTQPAAPLTAEKKKSKKGLIIGLCAGLALVAVALVLFFTLFSGSPVERALYGTLKDASDMLHAGNLGKAVTNLEKINKTNQARAELEFDVSGIEGIQANGTLSLDENAKTRLGSGDLTYSLNLGGETSGGTVRFATDLKDVQFAVDGVDGVYGVNLAEAMADSGMGDLLGRVSTEQQNVTLAALKKGPMKPIFDSLKTEEDGQTRIVADGGDKICTHYVLTWDEAAVEQVADALDEQINSKDSTAMIDAVAMTSYSLTNLLRECKPTLDLYIAGNRLIGADLYPSHGSTVYLRLLGEKNVVSHLRVSSSEDETQTDLYWQKADSLRLCTTEDGQQTEILRYTDADGRITLNSMLTEGMQADLYLKPEGSGATLTAKLSGSELAGGAVSAALRMLPVKEAPKLLADSYTDITKMSDEESGKLMGELSEELGLDALLGSFGGMGFGDDYDFDIDDPGSGFGDDDTDTWDWGDDDSDETEAPAAATGLTADDVAGSFDLDHLTAGGMDYDLSLIGMSAEDNYITLWSDGTGIIVLEGNSVKINWSYDGTELVISDRDTDGEAPYTLIVQDKDTILLDAESAYFVYKRDN